MLAASHSSGRLEHCAHRRKSRSPRIVPISPYSGYFEGMNFSFEDLDVYKKAVNWASTVETLAKQLHSQASRTLIDQLTRAALSISLNIAEGNGRWHKAEKRQFLMIARGSTFECVPILQVLRTNNLIEETRYLKFRSQLVEIGKMINGLLKSIERLK